MTYRCAACSRTFPDPRGVCPHCSSRRIVRDHRAINQRSAPILIGDVQFETKAKLKSGLTFLDQVLDGGYARGYSMLIAGGPGTGKSTLALQACNTFALHQKKRALYVTSEENKERVAARSARCGDHRGTQTIVYAESAGDRIFEELERVDSEYDFFVLDSVQTTTFNNFPLRSTQGAIELVMRAHRWATDNHKIAMLLCQEIKDGDAAGPKLLEHIVDAFLQLTFHEEIGRLRYLYVSKNREGEAPAQVQLKMTATGLEHSR